MGDKRLEDASARERENIRRDKVIVDRIEKIEERLNQLEKRVEEIMEGLREVREIKEMIIGVRIGNGQEENTEEEDGEVEIR